MKSNKLKTFLILIIFFTSIVSSIIPINFSYAFMEENLGRSPPNSPVGFDHINRTNILQIWNDLDSYFFDMDSCIQLSNHYQVWWSHNVMGLGYYSGGEWNLIYWTDTLKNFNVKIKSDNQTYVNVTLWRDLSYQEYDFRFAIRYNLELGDAMLTVQPYIKNLGQNIPFDIGFAWRLKDIKISNDVENDKFYTSWLTTNGTGGESYFLDQELDIKYVYNVTGFMVKDEVQSQVLEMQWKPNIINKTILHVKSTPSQYNAPITIYVKVGSLSPQQEKTTQFLWHDANLIDSHTDTAADVQPLTDHHPSDSPDKSAYGQTFTSSGSYNVTSVKFKLNKVGNPTGNATAVLYNIQDTYGVDATPTEPPLATSNKFDVSTLGAGLTEITFTFNASQRYTIDYGYYVIVFQNPTAGLINGANRIQIHFGNTTHSGRAVWYLNGAWGSRATDCYFLIYGDKIDKVSIALPFDGENETTATTEDWGSGYDNVGTINGATRTPYGYFGKAMSFDGVDDYIDCGDHASLNKTGNFTVMAWVNQSSTHNGTIISKGRTSDLTNLSYALMVIDNYVVFSTNGSGGQVNSTSISALTNGIYTHVAASVNDTHQNLYINGVLEDTDAQTGILQVDENFYVGAQQGSAEVPFNGIIDEVRVWDTPLSQAFIQGNMSAIIATYPYNDIISISEMAAGGWLFAEETYTFVAEYVRQNSSFPLDYVSMGWNDGVYWINGTYDVTADTWTFNGVPVTLLVRNSTLVGNVRTVNHRITLTEDISGILNGDLYMRCNDTSSRFDGWEINRLNYYNIYSQGGTTECDSSADPNAGSLVGGSVFDLAAQNSSFAGGSWARCNVTWRNFQHIRILTHWWQGTTWDVGNTHWNCPNEHANTGYVEYGVDYLYNGTWLEGWKAHIEIEDGRAEANHAWIELNVSWYNRGYYVKSDSIFAYYESHESSDNATQFSLHVDLWISTYDASSTIAGRINSEYYGMQKTGWLLWTNWKPRIATREKSIFFDDLQDSSNFTIQAKYITLFNVWAKINKTAPDGGAPDCDSHQWAIMDYDIDWLFTLDIEEYIGIDVPIYDPTRVIDMAPPGSLASLATTLINGISRPIVEMLAYTSAGATQAFAKFVDAGFGYFGVPNIIAIITGLLGSFVGYMVTSVTNFTNLMVTIFTLFASTSGFIISWLTRIIAFFVSLIGNVVSIFDGTNTVITGLTNVWTLMNFNTWIDFVPIIMVIAWFDSIDKRARLTGGWLLIFVNDVQIMISIISYIASVYFMIMNMIIDLVFRFINIVT